MGEPINILIVEDTPDDAELMVRAVAAAGYDTTWRRVYSLATMTEALESQRWDAVLCDFSLPGFGALSALRLMKDKELDAPFIIVSGTITEDAIVAAMKAGATDFVLKCNLMNRLVPAIKRGMDELSERRENKRLEHTVIESERRYRAVVNCTTDVVYEWDLADDTLTWHGDIDGMLGYAPGEFPRSLKAWEDIILPADHGRVMASIDKCIKNKQRFCVEYGVKKKDGSVCFWETSGQVVVANGVPNGIGAVRDITGRKRAEESFRESERRFQQLAESTFEGIAISKDTLLIDGNTQLAKMVGQELAEMTGRSIVDFIAPQSRQDVADHIRTSSELPYEFFMLRKDGSVFPAEARARMTIGNGMSLRVTAIRDLSDSKKAYQSLLASEEKLRTIFDNAVDGAVIMDPETGLFHSANAAFCSMLRYSMEEIINIGFQDIHFEEDLARLKSQFITTSRGVVGQSSDIRVRRKDGSVFFADVHSGSLSFEGKTFLLKFFRDITERKQAQQEVQREKRFTELIKNVVVMINNASTFLEAVQGALDVSCTHTEFPVGHFYVKNKGTQQLTISGIWHMDDIERFQAFREVTEATSFSPGKGLPGRVYESGEPLWIADVTRDSNFLRASIGRDIAVKCGVALPVLVGNEVVAVMEFYRPEVMEPDESILRVMAQISTHLGRAFERKQAEETLRQSEEQLRLMFESAADGILLADVNGVVQKANGKTAELLGYSTGTDLVGKTFFDFVIGREHQEVREEMQHVVELGSVRDMQVTLTRKDGSAFSSEVAAGLQNDASGTPAGFVVTFRDVTKRKQFEQEIVDSNRRLEAAQAELLASQRQIIQQERLKAVGIMASGIAHDFNNSLVGILGFSELLLTRPAILEDKEKTLRFIRTIHESGTNAAEVVRRLRQFYRAPDETETFSPLHINSIIADVIGLTRPKWEGQAQEKGIQIQVKTELAETPAVMGTQSDLHEAFTNLLFNAVDAMPQGGVVTFTSCWAGLSVTIAVADTGTGMTPEVVQRCMEPFFTTKGEKGTGLGLSLVHGIVQRHGGKITIDSKPGQGTTITIHLPAGVSGVAGTVSTRSVLPVRSLRVLVVDDEPTVREVVSELLRLDGHAPQTASDGEEALYRLGAPAFDLVITDRAMPKMHGDQLAAIIKARYPGMLVIMLTGFGDKIIALKEQIPGVDVVVAKPVTREALQQAISLATARSASGSRD